MSILYILIPLGLVFLGVAVWGFLWAVRSGQFDDMDGPAHRILLDDDDPRIPSKKSSFEESGEHADEAKTDKNTGENPSKSS